MSAAPTCPRCRGILVAPGLMNSAWTCSAHGAVAPLHPPRPGTSEQLAQIATRSVVPVWLPWPLPSGWLVTGLQHAGDERSGPVATVVALSGPNPLPGDGLEHQPTADLLVAGGPQAKVYAAGHPAPLWHVPAEVDRAAYVGEAHGVWLWMVMWPSSAGALVLDGLRLVDARDPGHPLDVPTGAPSPRLS